MIRDINIAADAAIAGSKISTATMALASAKVLVGSSGGVAAAVTLSGDVTNDNAGVTAIGAGKVTNAMVAPAALDGTVAKVVANVNVIGGLPILYRITLADTGAATTNTDVTLTHKTRIVDAWFVKTGGDALNNDVSTLTIKNGTTAISDVLSIQNKSDKTITRFTTLDDAQYDIAAAGTLRIEQILANATDNNAGEVYVLGIRVA